MDNATWSIGHWTDEHHRTGCTVILFDRLCPAVVDVRGGAPGTRETELLASDRLVGKVDAILLTGGSAFGLAAAGGIMRYLYERGRGVPTSNAAVPIVPAAVIYDLGVGEVLWPTETDAYAACESAEPVERATFGRVGVGTGATYRKLWPGLDWLDGGIGQSSRNAGDNRVTAISVVNAVGDVVPSARGDRRVELIAASNSLDERSATTLVVVVVDGDCDERTLRRVAIAANDGIARAIVPCHTIWDGDLVFAIQTGQARELDASDSVRIAVATELAVEDSIRSAVGHAV